MKGATGAQGLDAARLPVSIHAPVKGATMLSPETQPQPDRFNPRAREGRDISACAGRVTVTCFNPRAREGRDNSNEAVSPSHWVSIHAPVKGATSFALGRARLRSVSIHAPVKGAT